MTRKRCAPSSLKGELGESHMGMVVMHQVLRLLVAGRAVLDLDRRVSDSEVGAQPLLDCAHDFFGLGERLIPNHDVAAAGYVLGRDRPDVQIVH